MCRTAKVLIKKSNKNMLFKKTKQMLLLAIHEIYLRVVSTKDPSNIFPEFIWSGLYRTNLNLAFLY